MAQEAFDCRAHNRYFPGLSMSLDGPAPIEVTLKGLPNAGPAIEGRFAVIRPQDGVIDTQVITQRMHSGEDVFAHDLFQSFSTLRDSEKLKKKAELDFFLWKSKAGDTLHFHTVITPRIQLGTAGQIRDYLRSAEVDEKVLGAVMQYMPNFFLASDVARMMHRNLWLVAFFPQGFGFAPELTANDPQRDTHGQWVRVGDYTFKTQMEEEPFSAEFVVYEGPLTFPSQTGPRCTKESVRITSGLRFETTNLGKLTAKTMELFNAGKLTMDEVSKFFDPYAKIEPLGKSLT